MLSVVSKCFALVMLQKRSINTLGGTNRKGSEGETFVPERKHNGLTEV